MPKLIPADAENLLIKNGFTTEQIAMLNAHLPTLPPQELSRYCGGGDTSFVGWMRSVLSRINTDQSVIADPTKCPCCGESTTGGDVEDIDGVRYQTYFHAEHTCEDAPKPSPKAKEKIK